MLFDGFERIINETDSTFIGNGINHHKGVQLCVEGTNWQLSRNPGLHPLEAKNVQRPSQIFDI